MGTYLIGSSPYDLYYPTSEAHVRTDTVSLFILLTYIRNFLKRNFSNF